MFRKIIASQLSSSFRKAASIVSEPIPSVSSLTSSSVLLKNLFVGINASDINFTNGKYLPGVKPPFDTGFEAIATVQAKGSEVNHLNVGDAVAVTRFGCFSEFQVANAKECIKIPKPFPDFLPLLVSGLTASIALEQVGELKSNEKVLVTAAAGGTGVFAVQLAKLAGNHVIGTVGDDKKVEFLKKLGCDRVINYKKENVRDVLRKEYPEGVDIVYESVGGEMFDICANALAVKGRLIVIGAISGYSDGSAWGSGNNTNNNTKSSSSTPLPTKLLAKSASIRGFFLNHYKSHFKKHMEQLIKAIEQGKLRPVLDQTKFYGLEQVCDAIDHMYQGKNIGKVYVDLWGSPSTTSNNSKL